MSVENIAMRVPKRQEIRKKSNVFLLARTTMLSDTSIWSKYWKKNRHTHIPLTHEHMQGKVSWKEKERESGKKAGPLNLENLQEVGMVTLWHAAKADEETQICHQQAQPKTHGVEAGWSDPCL